MHLSNVFEYAYLYYDGWHWWELLSYDFVFQSGVQYTIAQDTLTCSIDHIPYSAKGFDAVQNLTAKTLQQRSPMQFFNLNENSYFYAGVRTCRGLKCDVYQTYLTNMPGFQIVIYEVYFLKVRGHIIIIFNLIPGLFI